MEPENYTISVYEYPFPQLVTEALDGLYQHMHSSYVFHHVYGNIRQGTNVYVGQLGRKVVTVILYRIEGGKVHVLNEQLRIAPEEIERFAKYMFAQYKGIKSVYFPVVENKVSSLAFPFQQPHCTQDIVLSMPESEEAYLGKLGKSTRSYVKRYLNKLKRSFPSVEFKTYRGDEVDEQDIREIIELNRARMVGRSMTSAIDVAETDRIIALTKACGLVCVMRIDGRICAGTINYRTADNYFLKVLAHDPAYDQYGLGTLCCYLTICECISRKGKEYHFMWGRFEYKYRLLGIQRDLSRLVIYRSQLDMLLSCRSAVKLWTDGWMYDLKDWLEHHARREDASTLSGRMLFRFLNMAKRLKRTIKQARSHQHADTEYMTSTAPPGLHSK